jgi:phosphoglycolate phosphatase-like HAD superfamily hydrolase
MFAVAAGEDLSVHKSRIQNRIDPSDIFAHNRFKPALGLLAIERMTRFAGQRIALRLALKQMGLAPGACVYVGDSPHDLEMAWRAGVRAVAVLGRFPTEKGLRAARPEFLLDSISELPRVLEEI